MKERRLRILITSAAVALVSLIAIQIYWVTNAVKLEEERFNNNVTDALNSVVNKFEKEETASLVLRSLTEDQDVNIRSVNSNDTLINSVIIIEKNNRDTNDEADSLKSIKINLTKKVSNDSAHSVIQFYSDDSNLVNIDNHFIDKSMVDSFIYRKSKVVEEIVSEIVDWKSRNFVRRNIDQELIDSLLRVELNDRNITTEYYYGVFLPDEKTPLFTNQNADKILLKKSTLRARLFPEDVFSDPAHLSVYFPNQQKFLIESISGVLLISIFIIISIIYLYFKTVRMLIRQKRITDIKNDLINNITHEFKTPISTISLACETIEQSGSVLQNPDARRYLKAISEENNRLGIMVDKLLTSAQLENGKLNLKFECVDVKKILEKCVKSYSTEINNKKGSINVKVLTDKTLITADGFHLTTLVMNLIDNAVKHSSSKPEIEITLNTVESMLQLSVSDKGIGIDKKNLKKIFDTFYRVPSGNIHNTKGYGIGLSSVKQIAEAHGGKVKVKSRVSRGTEFIVLLPLGND